MKKIMIGIIIFLALAAVAAPAALAEESLFDWYFQDLRDNRDRYYDWNYAFQQIWQVIFVAQENERELKQDMDGRLEAYERMQRDMRYDLADRQRELEAAQRENELAMRESRRQMAQLKRDQEQALRDLQAQQRNLRR